MAKAVVRVAAVLAAAGALAWPALPAGATVHEIVAQWCSGHDPLEPPGITGGSNADNFAQPLFSNGFIGAPVPFDGPDGPGLLITFDYDHPASKVQGTGNYFVIGQTPAGPLYVEQIEPDPSFPAFQYCPRLAG